MPSASLNRIANSAPPQTWFAISAVFHYLGPSFAVLLFPAVGVLGVAWFRIASAALVLAPFTRPWQTLRAADGRTGLLLIGLGLCLAVMNTAFYLALDRLPMSLVAAMEFVGTIGVALYGLRTCRNIAALALAVMGVVLLIDVTWQNDPAGLAWAALSSRHDGLLHRASHRTGHADHASGSLDWSIKMPAQAGQIPAGC